MRTVLYPTDETDPLFTTWHNGGSPSLTGLTLSGLTPGRIVFPGAGGVLSGDANLFWDNTNKRLGVGTTTPVQELDVVGTVVVSEKVGINNTNPEETLHVSGSAMIKAGERMYFDGG